jgi:hypothetical protein
MQRFVVRNVQTGDELFTSEWASDINSLIESSRFLRDQARYLTACTVLVETESGSRSMFRGPWER